MPAPATRTAPQPRRTARALAGALVGLVVLTGCLIDDGEPESDMTPEEQFEVLMNRPDLDQAKRHYDELQQEIRELLRERFDLPEWEPSEGREGRRSGYCADFPDLDGLESGKVSTVVWLTRSSVVDRWPEVQDAVRELAGQYQFDDVTMDLATGDRRRYEIIDHYGAAIRIGSKDNTTLRASTGCHLTPEAKDRGRPLTTEEAREILREHREERTRESRPGSGGN